jgi:myo-inositol-1(or 4)-monophosphatase
VTSLTDAELAVAAATAGAEEVRSRYGRPVTRHAKEGTDFATSADLASEEAIRQVLAEHRPEDAMVGEEAGHTGPAGAAREWLVDPLCGTRNFAATTPLVAVNVALRADGRVLAAASADPLSGEVFWTDGSAAHVRRDGADAPVAPDPVSLLVDVDLDHPRSGDALHLLADATFRRDFSPRVGSSTLAMTWLAAGRRAAYVHEGDLRDNVHFAAPIAIAEVAGCIVTGIHGQPLHTAPHGLLAAADADTHARLLALVTAAG